MNTKNILIGVLAAAVLVFGILYFNANSKLNSLGGGFGPTHWQAENFLQGLFGGTAGQFHVNNSGKAIEGGSIINLVGDLTLTDAQLCSTSLIKQDMGGATKLNPTITLPSATNTPCLANNGDAVNFYIDNRATGTILFSSALGGIRFENASTTPSGANLSPLIQSNYSAKVSVVRLSSATTTWYFTPFQ